MKPLDLSNGAITDEDLYLLRDILYRSASFYHRLCPACVIDEYDCLPYGHLSTWFDRDTCFATMIISMWLATSDRPVRKSTDDLDLRTFTSLFPIVVIPPTPKLGLSIEQRDGLFSSMRVLFKVLEQEDLGALCPSHQRVVQTLEAYWISKKGSSRSKLCRASDGIGVATPEDAPLSTHCSSMPTTHVTLGAHNDQVAVGVVGTLFSEYDGMLCGRVTRCEFYNWKSRAMNMLSRCDKNALEAHLNRVFPHYSACKTLSKFLDTYIPPKIQKNKNPESFYDPHGSGEHFLPPERVLL